jgi:hypothetical protein
MIYLEVFSVVLFMVFHWLFENDEMKRLEDMSEVVLTLLTLT